MELRLCGPGDVSVIATLQEESYEPYRQQSAATLEARIADGGTYWLATQDARGAALGFLRVHRDGRTLRVTDLVASPRARGQGVGGQLLAKAESEARLAGADRMHVLAEELDPALLAWYESHGFERQRRLPDHFHAGCHAVELVKRL